MFFLNRSVLPFVLFLLGALLDLAAADALDFSLYPTAAQPCLYQAANSSACDHSTVPKFNGCVCSNGGGFIDSAAKCLGSSDAGDLNTVYSTMSSNCKDSNTPIAYTLSKWLSAAGSDSGSASTKTSATANTGATGATGGTGATDATSATKVQTVVQTLVAPTSAQGSPVVLTITQSPSAGQTSAVVQVVTLTPGQTTQLISVVTLTPSGTGTAAAAAQSTTAAAGTSSTSSGISTGAIVGIAVGAVVLFAIAGALLFFFLRKRKQNSSNHDAPVSEPAYVGPYPSAGDGGNHQQSYANVAPVKSEAEKYQQAQQQYPPSTPSPAPAYTQPQPQQYNPYLQQHYDGHYVPPPNASYAELSAPSAPVYNGAAELHGRPSAPMHAHELAGH